MQFRELITEALDKNNTIARYIVKGMGLANWKNISQMSEPNYDFIKNICIDVSQKFDDASDEDKQIIMDKVYSSIHTNKEEPELEENSQMTQSEIKQKILDYVQKNGAILYPLEKAAEDLANSLTSEKKDEACPECGKEPCKCCDDCEKKESTLTEATMNDIPHEIDDPIHILKDMRFELEQTQRNWDLAGVKTEPMDEILSNIDDLIANLYQNGAKMADDELSKDNSEEPKEDEKKDEEKEEK